MDMGGQDHPNKAGYCHIRNEVFGPTQVDGPRVMNADNIYIDVKPLSKVNKWGGRGHLDWKLEPQTIVVTFWWKTPSPDMECEAYPGELQYARKLAS